MKNVASLEWDLNPRLLSQYLLPTAVDLLAPRWMEDLAKIGWN